MRCLRESVVRAERNELNYIILRLLALSRWGFWCCCTMHHRAGAPVGRIPTFDVPPIEMSRWRRSSTLPLLANGITQSGSQWGTTTVRLIPSGNSSYRSCLDIEGEDMGLNLVYYPPSN